MAGRIFISYRRTDAKADARSIYQRLQRDFGSQRLFIDVDSIGKGVDFRTELVTAVAATSVMMVLIGKDWLTACTDEGKRRLDDPADYVRLEIASALAAKKRVLPILIDGADMPAEASRLAHDNFSSDMAGIIASVASTVPRSRLRRRRALTAVACIGVLATLVIAFSPSLVRLGLGLQHEVVVIDKATYVEMLMAQSKQLGTQTAGLSDAERDRLSKELDKRLTSPESSYATFVAKTSDLLATLEKLRSLVAAPLISEAKAQTKAGDFKQAQAVLQELIGQWRAGKASREQVAGYAEQLAGALMSVGDLRKAISTYADVMANVDAPGRLVRAYAEALLAAGQYRRAIALLQGTLEGPRKSVLADIDLAWLHDALGQAYEAVGDLDVAQENFIEAHRLVTAAVRAKQAPATDLASILNDMTSVSLRRNDMTTARASLCESVTLSTETRGATHRNTLIARLNLVGLSRQMGLIGAARRQLDLTQADLGSLPPTDPVRGALFLNTALLAISIGSFHDATAPLSEAEKFYEGLGEKGQGYTQQMARIAELRLVALLGLGELDKAMESGEAARELYRRAFGRLSAPELNVIYWMTRTAVAQRKLDQAEALSKGFLSGIDGFKGQDVLLAQKAQMLEAELALTNGKKADALLALENLIQELFEREARGEAYIALTDDAIALLFAASDKPSTANAIKSYRQAKGQRTLVLGGSDKVC
jgi:tetratricopeptide (TPR) repeat protein